MAYISTTIAPTYGTTNPNNGSYFFHITENIWYDPAGVAMPYGVNFLNHIVYADNDGSPLYVEELPKTEYKDSLQVNSLNVLSGFNLNQTWQNMTSQRVAGATYTNTTGKPIIVSVTGTTTASNVLCGFAINGGTFYTGNDVNLVNGAIATGCVVIPVGASYKYIQSNGTISSLIEWSELR